MSANTRHWAILAGMETPPDVPRRKALTTHWMLIAGHSKLPVPGYNAIRARADGTALWWLSKDDPDDEQEATTSEGPKAPAETYLGLPCFRGHKGIRYLSSNQCLDCCRVTRAQRAQRKKAAA